MNSSRSRAAWRNALALALGITASCITWAAASRADCNREPGHQLRAASPTLPAEALWFDAHTLRWPGRDAAGVYRLHHSARGVVQAPPGGRVRGADGSVALTSASAALPATIAARFAHVAAGVTLQLPETARPRLRQWHRGHLLLVQHGASGEVLAATAVQHAAALDELFADAEREAQLGAHSVIGGTAFKLWAPTAREVALCLYASAHGTASALLPMKLDERSGIWQARVPRNLGGQSYRYLVEVHARGTGWVRNLVTDPYSVALTADSLRSVVADLRSPALEPPGWRQAPSPHARAAHPVDMAIYELHVRDFSISDPTVRAAWRGKYLAFTEAESAGMKHLRGLAQAGITDVHLLPVFDIATIPERGCITPRVDPAPPDSDLQQAQVMATAGRDCFNWGYDPYHFNAPEGSYATEPDDGAGRIREFRAMVMALQAAGLRVGMDVVYNHTAASGQKAKSVLDRVVPGYYQRLNAKGDVETSTCCDNTATEHRMMGKLMVDSLVVWAKHHRIDSFRFDLMGHQPRALMEQAHQRLREELGREIHFIGEGWNFGEVADNKRFRQATQRELGGTGIGTFSDRGRDAVRGGGHDDSAERLVSRQGWLNGLHHDPNALGGAATRDELLRAADLVRVALAGTLRGYTLRTHTGEVKRLEQMAYAGQPAGYASQPAEVVNYVDNHDNQTLFDINALRLPQDTSREDRARVQLLGAAITAFSQGVAYFHAGIETLRSKSLDRNSYNSGDWFNRLDWSLQDNFFGTGLPPKQDNGSSWAVMRPVLANALIKPTSAEITWMRDAFRDLLRIRSSTTLLRLRDADEVARRLTFHNTGPEQQPTLMAAHLDGSGLDGAGFKELVYFVNAGKSAQALDLPAARGKPYTLHPVHLQPLAADRRVDTATFEIGGGRFNIPARTAVVFVLQ